MLNYTFKKNFTLQSVSQRRDEANEIISSLFHFIPSLGVLSVACLTMGGHIIPLVSRPVWYAASSAAAGSPAPSPDSDLKP